MGREGGDMGRGHGRKWECGSREEVGMWREGEGDDEGVTGNGEEERWG